MAGASRSSPMSTRTLCLLALALSTITTTPSSSSTTTHGFGLRPPLTRRGPTTRERERDDDDDGDQDRIVDDASSSSSRQRPRHRRASARGAGVIVEISPPADDVRGIMDLLRTTYPDDAEDDDDADDVRGWTRTRNYLYRHRASCRRASLVHVENARTGRRRRREPLTPRNVASVLSFLDEAFPGRPGLQARVLRRTPRILGRWESIDSQLRPTVDFLRGLYGGMSAAVAEDDDGDDGGGEEGEGGRFYEAIRRNTDLLLVRGVGYAGGGGGRRATTAGVDEDVDDADDDYDDGGGGDDAETVEGYLRRELGVSSSRPADDVVAGLRRDHPTIFRLSLKGRVRPVVECLRTLLSAGGDEVAAYPGNSRTRRVLTRAVTCHPTLLHLDVEANLLPTADFLRDSCGLSDRELAAVISATPGVLGLSVMRNLGPTMGFLRDVLTCYGRGGGGGRGGRVGGVAQKMHTEASPVTVPLPGKLAREEGLLRRHRPARRAIVGGGRSREGRGSTASRHPGGKDTRDRALHVLIESHREYHSQGGIPGRSVVHRSDRRKWHRRWGR